MSDIERNAEEAANKSRYSREADAKFLESAAKLAVLNAKIESGVADGILELSAQLTNVQNQAETHLAAVKRRLKRLKDAEDDSWQGEKRSLEDGWEELSRSIKNIVARIS